MDPTLDTLTPRLDRLERAYRRTARHYLSLSDQNGKDRAVLSAGTSGPSLALRDENQKARAVLGHTELEATVTGAVEQRPASSLVLFDKDGKVIWKAP